MVRTGESSAEQFRRLRQKAAELELRRFEASGRDVIIIQRRDPDAVSTIHKIPAIFETIDLRVYEEEKAAAISSGWDPSKVPSPVPLLDFAAWTYRPLCPRCNGRQLEIDTVGYIGGMNTPDACTGAAAPSARAVCARPTVRRISRKDGKSDRDRNCGWTGHVRDLLLPCLECGEKAPGVVDGQCKRCANPEIATQKPVRKRKKGGARKKTKKKVDREEPPRG